MKQGGNRTGAGRKPKATELELIELLTPLDAIAFKSLEKGVKAGEYQYIKLYFEYRYGKPKQVIDNSTNQMLAPKIILVGTDIDETYI